MTVGTKIDTRLRLEFEDGVDLETGTVILKTKTFNNVKTSATLPFYSALILDEVIKEATEQLKITAIILNNPSGNM